VAGGAMKIALFVVIPPAHEWRANRCVPSGLVG
jgi:hypothetical protein